MKKFIQSCISTSMFFIMTIGVALAYAYITSDSYKTTDPETVEQLDRWIERNRTLPISQMTRRPIGYFDENIRWVSFDRTDHASYNGDMGGE